MKRGVREGSGKVADMRIYVSPFVVAEEMKDGLCLLHTGRGECHLLNATAASVWTCLSSQSEGLELDDLTQQMCERHGIASDLIASDVEMFIFQAEQLDIIYIQRME